MAHENVHMGVEMGHRMHRSSLAAERAGALVGQVTQDIGSQTKSFQISFLGQNLAGLANFHALEQRHQCKAGARGNFEADFLKEE